MNRSMCSVSKSSLWIGIFALTALFHCSSVGHIREADRAFEAKEFHQAYTHYRKAIESKEAMPEAYTEDVLRKKMEKTKGLAALDIAARGRHAMSQSNYTELMQQAEIAALYPDQEETKEFLSQVEDLHVAAMRSLKDAEMKSGDLGPVKALQKFSWYVSGRDRFYNRYTQVMEARYAQLMQSAKNQFARREKLELALKSTDDALLYFPHDGKARELKVAIQQAMQAQDLKDAAKRDLKSKRPEMAYLKLQEAFQLDPADRAIPAELEKLRLSATKSWLKLAQKNCAAKNWWMCRIGLLRYAEMGLELPEAEHTLAYRAEADQAMATSIFSQAQKYMKQGQPEMALLHLRVARSFGGDLPDAADLEQKALDAALQATRYQVSLQPPTMAKGRSPVESAMEEFTKKLQERMTSDAELNDKVDFSRVNAEQIDAHLVGKFEIFSIQRSSKPEKRSAQYVHHQEQRPNPEFLKSKDRVIASEKQRNTFFHTVQQQQTEHDEAQKQFREAKDNLELAQQKLEQERVNCEARPDPNKLKAMQKDMGDNISDAIRQGDDKKIQALVNRWKDSTPQAQHLECHLEFSEQEVDRTETNLKQQARALAKIESELKESKQKYLELTNTAFDAEIALKEVSPTISVNVMATHNYTVTVDDVKGALKVTYKLNDKLTRQVWNTSEASAEVAESDFATDEIGITPPEFDYQVLEKAKDSNVSDDVEVTEKMIDDAVNQLLPQMKAALLYHGRRFVTATEQAETPSTRARYAVLGLLTNDAFLTPEKDRALLKDQLKAATGYDWDTGVLDWQRAPANFVIP